MIGTLDQETYAARRTALQASIAAAQAEYDRDSLAAELAGDVTFDPTVARANIQHLEDRLHSLDRAWVVAQQQALASNAAELESERLAEIEKLKSLGAEAFAAADEMQKSFNSFMGKLSAYVDLASDFRSQIINVTTDSPHQSRTLDILSHNMVGPCIVGKLRAANLPSLDDFGAVGAMRAFAGMAPAAIAKERIRKALDSAAQDIPELKAD